MWGWLRKAPQETEFVLAHDAAFEALVREEQERIHQQGIRFAEWVETMTVQLHAAQHAATMQKIRRGRRRVRWSGRSTTSPLPPRGPRVNHVWMDEAWELMNDTKGTS